MTKLHLTMKVLFYAFIMIWFVLLASEPATADDTITWFWTILTVTIAVLVFGYCAEKTSTL